ncbi:nuclear transport factor 2 family protein [Thalassotalea sp. LPB0316]|uniref:nuclear transport factor 2 family protein n=1 Tax=Thalassotalea sp. LPB0316 TaxID=2769490 RepID=UPI0018682728|nr:nuclear transport factor 2 family protein [Thalassotalea sp. LPB0316]QOL26008.1 nuclear transport factor 2 family protein [Thalassotalea sp. LPB0316]
MRLFIFMTALLIHSVAFGQNYHQQAKDTLASFHLAAAQADTENYFNLMHHDFIFLGTDATERWTKSEFAAFVKPYFSKGIGWRYTPTQQNITQISEHVLFFDELLEHKKYGQCRGSGVLVNVGGKWLLNQYNLSIPMPNDLAADLVQQIRQHQLSQEGE